MRNKWILITIVALVLVVARGITHKYGPYYGKVVDAETGEPIEKAVVAVWFSTETGTFGGSVHRVEDAVETLTDANGEFRIPAKRLYQYKILSAWDDRCGVSIYMPGYAAYPADGLKAYSSVRVKGSPPIPEKKYVTYYLSKLLTIEERKYNFGHSPGGKADEKLPNLMKYIDEREKMAHKVPMENNK
jgi:hypothetical protein